MISKPTPLIDRRDAIRISGAWVGAWSASSIVSAAESRTDTFRVAFGSCAKQQSEQPIWNEIIAKSPDLFIFLGDVVYSDSTRLEDFHNALNQLGRKPEFQKLLSACPVLAVWDDHDYGINDGGMEHPKKEEFQKEFLKFFRVRTDAPPWHREGLYCSQNFDRNHRTIQVILLDTRYHRSPLKSIKIGGVPIYLPDRGLHQTILGDKQWDWLESLLREPADVRIIASSIQVLPESHPAEKWGNFPRERERLLEAVRQASGVTVLISGDQHLGELSAIDTQVGKLYELTSSGLTHTRENIPAPNHIRVGRPLIKKNFGLIEIATSVNPIGITLTVCDEHGQTKIHHVV